MSFGTLSGLISLTLLLAFIGICLWAYSGKRRNDFDEAARLPLQEDAAHSGERKEQGNE
ncbi:cbb3-type cytochrome oxidase subunit 3 [Arhodomonas sp. AD133]|uniref:cbb3-type cytochrome oxidase subunit 3 n=1 Tax=Arhodomonas sp. AD133 TaxID=3415009 RepID=UPI003EBE7B47